MIIFYWVCALGAFPLIFAIFSLNLEHDWDISKDSIISCLRVALLVALIEIALFGFIWGIGNLSDHYGIPAVKAEAQ